MKKINLILIITSIFLVCAFVISNLIITFNSSNEDLGRPYRVEINEVVIDIESKGLNNINIDDYEYVTKVVECENINQAIKTNSDYVIKEINSKLYRIEYSYMEKDNTNIYILVNTILGIISIFIICLLFYIRSRIIKPFNRLSIVPYELSKGNLTTPLKEEQGKYFGKFVWGIDLLRENIEQQKARELELQKEKKTLLLSLSHDIKTPLSAIKLYSKAISTGLYEGKKKESEIADSINNKADEIESYISEIIKTANEDLFKYDVNIDNYYLSKLIKALKDYYEEKLGLIHTEFIINEFTDCMLKADFDRSVEVIQNIIENAIKYGDGERIEISFREEDGYQLVEVFNTGSKVNDNELPYIFESFYRGTNTENKPGSGLGLYICKQLMNKMNGEIFAESKDNGICITVVFMKA